MQATASAWSPPTPARPPRPRRCCQQPAERHRHRQHAHGALVRAGPRLSTPPRSRPVRPWLGRPGSGTAVLPLTFSWCECRSRPVAACPRDHAPCARSASPRPRAPSAAPAPRTTSSRAASATWTPPRAGARPPARGERSDSSTGNTPPSVCSPEYGPRGRWSDAPCCCPCSTDSAGTGNNAWYHVYGYAAFEITGYFFGGHFTAPEPCSGNERCVAGRFTRFVDRPTPCTSTRRARTSGACILRLIR